MGGGGGKQHGEEGGWRSERCLVAVRVWETENVANAMSCSQYGALVPGVSNNRMQTDKRLLRVRPREFSTGPFTGSFYGSVYGVLQRVRVCGDSTGPCMGFFYGSVCGLLLRVRVRALSMGPCTGSFYGSVHGVLLRVVMMEVVVRVRVRGPSKKGPCTGSFRGSVWGRSMGPSTGPPTGPCTGFCYGSVYKMGSHGSVCGVLYGSV